MANILVLKPQSSFLLQNTKLLQDTMHDECIAILATNSVTYTNIEISSFKELPILLNALMESYNYDAIICLGILEEDICEDTNAFYAEILGSMYEFMLYFNVIISSSIIFKKLDVQITEEIARQYVNKTVKSTLHTISSVKNINDIESVSYVGRHKHN